MYGLSSAGMKMDSEGKYYSQGKGSQALSGVRVEHWTGTEAHIRHRYHLTNESKDQCHAQ